MGNRAMRSISPSELYRMSRATASAFAAKVPPGQTLAPFQIAGVEYLCAVQRGLEADPPGLGKTPISIASMNTLGIDQYLVVCPASLCENWRREIVRWSTGRFEPFVFQTGKPAPRDSILIMSFGVAGNVEIIRRIQRGFPAAGLIIDEAHYCKNLEAGRTLGVLGRGGLTSRIPVVFALTGTPLGNRPIELYPIASRLNPAATGCDTEHEYAVKYCDAFHDGFQWNYRGAKNLAELGRRLRSSIMIRRDKAAVLPQLPPKIRRAIYLDKNVETSRLVERECGYFEAAQAGKLRVTEEGEAFRVRVQLGLIKVPAAAAYIRMVLESGVEKAIAFGVHRDVLAGLIPLLADFQPVVITGATDPRNRSPRVDRFQTDPACRLFLGSIKAAGVGHDLTAATHVFMVESEWTPGDNEQAEDRPHRFTQTKSVVIDYLLFSGSADDKTLAIVNRKAKNIGSVLNS